MSGGVAYVWNKDGNFDYFCNMEMVELSLIEEASYRKELHELIRQHYLYTGSNLARIMLDDWNRYVDEFIQIVPIEYKKVSCPRTYHRLQSGGANFKQSRTQTPGITLHGLRCTLLSLGVPIRQ